MRGELQLASHCAVEIFIHSFAPTLTAGMVLLKSWPLEIFPLLESCKKIYIFMGLIHLKNNLQVSHMQQVKKRSQFFSQITGKILFLSSFPLNDPKLL